MTEISQQDLNKIKEVHNLWIGKELEGNGSEVIDLCTEDVQWLPPSDPPMVGKEEIAKHLAAHPTKVESIEISDVCIHGSGSLAYLISNYRTHYFAPGHSGLHESRGSHLWILRKEDDDWRVAVVTWTVWH
jgi:ketosteroid isomerase-like protein